MESVFEKISRAIVEGRVTFTDHADDRLAERHIEAWQVVDGFDSAKLIEVDPKAKPNPKVVTRQALADGTPVIAVWAFVKSIDSATLITVYYPDE